MGALSCEKPLCSLGFASFSVLTGEAGHVVPMFKPNGATAALTNYGFPTSLDCLFDIF
jgi:hypothetical protein